MARHDKPEWGVSAVLKRNINPDGPKGSPEMSPAPPRVIQEESQRRGLSNPSSGRGGQGGNGGLQQPPVQQRVRKPSAYCPYEQLPASSGRPGARSEQSYERSPLHPQQSLSLRPGAIMDCGFGKSPAHPIQARSPKVDANSNQRFERSPHHPQLQARTARQGKDKSYEGAGAKQTREDAESLKNPKMSPAQPRIVQEETLGRGLSKPSSRRGGRNGGLQQPPVQQSVTDSSAYSPYEQLPAPSGRPGARSEQSYERSRTHPQPSHSPRPGGFEKSPVHPNQSRSPKVDAKPNRRYERSPLHPQLRPKTVRQGKDKDYEGTRAKQIKQDPETPDEEVAIPEFSTLNRKDSEKVSEIFGIIFKSRQNPNHPLHTNRSNPPSESKKSWCCFPW